MAEMRKDRKGRKNTPKSTPLTPQESAALKLYRSGTINIDDYAELVGCKPIKVAKANDSFDSPERFAPPPPPPPPEPIDDDKVLQEIDDYMNGGPSPRSEPPRESDWVMPSPPPDDLLDKQRTEATIQVVPEKEEHESEKSEHKVDKCYLWCFRCPPRLATHEIRFGDGKIPDWLKLEGEIDNPPFIPICCGQCNRELRDECDNRDDEEDNIRKGFLCLKTNWHAFSKEPRQMAAVRAGGGVALFKRAGRIAHRDIDLFRSGMCWCDSGETLDLELFQEDPKGDFGTGKLVGGLF